MILSFTRALVFGKPVKELFVNLCHPGVDGVLQISSALKPVGGHHPKPPG
jgi:hypothetical protein